MDASRKRAEGAGAMFDRQLLALPGIRRAFCAAAAFAAAQGALVVAMAWCLARALTNLWDGASFEAQAGLLAGFAAGFLGAAAVRAAQDAWFARWASRVASAVRREALAAVFSDGAALVDGFGSAAITTLLLEDGDVLEKYLRTIVPRMGNAVVIAVFVIVALFAFDWVSGLIVLVMMPVIGLYMALLGSMARKAATSQRAEYERLSNAFSDTMRGIDTVVRLGLVQAWERSLEATSEKFRAATMKVLRTATLSGSVLDLISTLSLAAVAIMLGFRLVDGSVTLFCALASLVLVPECFKPVRAFASDFHASLEGRSALAAQRRLMDEHRKAARRRLEGAQRLGAPASAGATGRSFAASNLTLSFEGASVDHGGRAALAGCTFSVRQPERVGIVGASGAGKSTLASLAAGFRAPDAGSVTLDGACGEGADAWRREVLYLPQAPTLFHGTLRDNVALYTPEADDEAVLAAVRAVGLAPLVDALDGGLDGVIGQGGRQLSGGQAQRVALARAFLDRTRRLLVFDEPTAHLDVETEYELKQAMVPLMEGRLVLFATHRLHWLDVLDRVVVLAAGKIEFDGSPDEALRKSPTLRAMAYGEGGRP
ncbi:thiol reductant ABC exporter subunit CydD [Eggerthellaceae bacterium zg-893]|nr:thiol reductant ABC exporter subunit CydD [Eggerthellaceae bacterium zg-893]